MNKEIISGLFLLMVLVLSYGLAYLVYLRGRISLSLGIIIFAGLTLRIFCALDPMLHPWDERFHALVAKNMMADPFTPKLYPAHIFDFDFKNWTANNIWLHKQPFPLWTMALSMKIFGISEFTLRIPSILLSTLSIYLTFWMGRFLSDSERVGLVAAFLLSINGLAIELASGRVSTDHVDTFFMFFILSSLFFILLNLKNGNRGWLALAGIGCGLAILTKWLPGLIIFPLYLVLNFKNKKLIELLIELSLMGLFMLIIAAPWQLYAQSCFPLEYGWEQHYNNLHLTEGLEGHGQPWWYFINKIRITINELIYLVFGWFVYQVFKSKSKEKEWWFLISWIGIPFLIFSLAATKMQGYLLFTFPAWFIIIGMFVENLLTAKSVGGIPKIIYRVLVGAIFILAFRYGLERVKPFEIHEAERQLKKELTEKVYSKNSVIFNQTHSIEWMFYNNGLAYPIQLENEIVDSLVEEGWLVY